jgi:Bacterial pre-peptidase C-terminal domain
MRPRSRTIALFSAALLVMGTPFAFAKPPTLTSFFPAGAARGQSLTVTMSGTFAHWPVKCWVDSAGLSIEPGPEKGKLAIRVAADAEPGVRWMRVYDEEGATSLRPFIVGTLPEMVEVEPNDDPQHPQAIGLTSATVNGRLSPSGDVDGYSVSLDRGQRLVADLEANRHLGSPMDAVLQVVSAAGFVLAQNDDAVGRDPRILFEAPAQGTYVVRLFAFPLTPDSRIRFAGGDAFIYRLTLTTGGFLEHVFPLAVTQDRPTPLTAIGSNISESDRAWTIPPNEEHDVFSLVHPVLPGNTTVRRVSGNSVIEVEPNDLAQPQELSDRDSISGRIDPPGELDAYRISLRKGEKHVFSLESRTFGLPLDAVLQVLDADGKILAETDDVGNSRDPELAFTPPADGQYRVVICDLNGRGGPQYAYLLRALAPEPDFALSLSADKFDVISSKQTNIVVNIARIHGFTDTLDVMADDLPDGVLATTARSRQSDASAKSVTLEIRADGCSHPGPIRIVGRSADRKSRPRIARAQIQGFEAKTDRPWLTILPVVAPKKP